MNGDDQLRRLLSYLLRRRSRYEFRLSRCDLHGSALAKIRASTWRSELAEVNTHIDTVTRLITVGSSDAAPDLEVDHAKQHADHA